MQYLKTKTEDKIQLTGLLFPAENSKKIIINIHGMSGDIYTNSFYPAMIENYPKGGWSFLITENRGTHSITQFIVDNEVKNIGNTYEIFEDCIYDMDAWVNKAKELGYEEIWLQSHSLGTSKSIY